MNKPLQVLSLIPVATCLLALSAQAQTTTYNGNGNFGFNGTPGDGPVGSGMLTFTGAGTTLNGSITPGPNNGAGANGQLYDELVIYISTDGVNGVTSTAGLTDTTTVNSTLASAVSGYNGSLRSTINFASGFAADYAIAISPTQAQLGELFSVSSTGILGALGSINLAPTGGSAANYTFSFSLASIGSPTGFNFSTTYLDAHDSLYRSNEAFNTITDLTTTTNTGNPGQDTVTLGVDTFGTPTIIPEPSTWALMLGGATALVGVQARRRRCQAAM